MEDKFSWKRFGLFARAEWTGQRRAWLLKFGGLALFSSLVYLLMNMRVLLGNPLDTSSSEPYIARFLILCAVGVVVFLNISWSFKSYRARGSAVMQTMLPASKSEKFFYATLMGIVVVPVAVVAVLVLLDVIWAAILGFDSIFALTSRGWDTWKDLIPNDKQMTVWTGISLVCSSLSSMTFFLLGAVLFRRHPFLFTLLVSYGAYVVWFGIVQIMWFLGAEWIKDTLLVISNSVGFCITISLTLAFTCLWLYLAWRKFGKLSVVQ